MGRALVPAEDARSGGNAVIVLSHKGLDPLAPSLNSATFPPRPSTM
jgi:hypothetical protein